VAGADCGELPGARRRHHAPHARARGAQGLPRPAAGARGDHRRCAVAAEAAAPPPLQQPKAAKAVASLRALRPLADAAAHRVPPPLPSPALSTGDGSRNDGGDAAAANRTRGTAKACLQRYRIASAEVMALLAELAPGATLEKASIDEAYLVR